VLLCLGAGRALASLDFELRLEAGPPRFGRTVLVGDVRRREGAHGGRRAGRVVKAVLDTDVQRVIRTALRF